MDISQVGIVGCFFFEGTLWEASFQVVHYYMCLGLLGPKSHSPMGSGKKQPRKHPRVQTQISSQAVPRPFWAVLFFFEGTL